MKIAILGTGAVGQTLGAKFLELGHDVFMGSRTTDNENLLGWKEKTGGKIGTFDQAANDSEILFNCTNGVNSLDALALIDKSNLQGKILVDLANELEFKDGKLKSLASSDNSLVQKIQNAYPDSKVIKTFNTLNVHLMVNPGALRGAHNVFLSGDDENAKSIVSGLIIELGWEEANIVDLGVIETAVGPEMFMAFWVTLFASGKFGDNAMYNINIVK